MRLEDEIKQTKPFKDEFQKLMLNINFTSSYLNALLSEKLKPFGISPHQYNVLRILKGRFPESYCNQEITKRMIDKSSNATRIVDKLLEKKLVSRTEDKVDRRLVNIKITDLGLKLIEEINLNSEGYHAALISLGEDKARQMNAWLDELRS
jgi:DNA-binding MarR family transcriptional regulator